MELQWIDDFLALCQTRNFTRAAEARCTTQSAYSRRVQRLEEWRTGRRGKAAEAVAANDLP